MKNLAYLIIALVIGFTACEPVLEEKIDIGNPPTGVNFEYVFNDPNNISFTNTTNDDYFLLNWDMGALGAFSSENVDSLSFPLAGSYDIALTVFGKGGSATKTETIVIAEDIPSACDPVLEFLTDCTSRTWKINPVEGAFFVGPDLNTTWWANSSTDVTDRDCDFNDEFTFTSDGSDFSGTYDYNSQGDLWGETYMGFSADGCDQIANLPADRAEWGDGTFGFEIIPATATDPAKIKVTGLGAYLGIRKATNNGEVNYPVSEVTYDILDMRNEGSKRILEFMVNFGGGIWKFQFASDN